MLFRELLELPVAVLGFGAMRLPTINGNDADIDKDSVEKMVKYAFDNGINYFDTAWGYHAGNSETVMGEVLKKYPRELFYLASKFPGYDLANIPKVKEIFPKQLEKCQVKYFDFYLIHNVCEMNIDQYLDEKYEIMSYLLEQKKAGRIKHLGFSVHGSYEVMERFLAKYGQYMEFCQVQLNYIDFDFQECKLKMQKLKELKIPVIVMEPLRGGSLVKLNDNDKKIFDKYFAGKNPVEVAFQYLTSFSNVKVILSGMSNMEQLKENINIFDFIIPFKDDQKAAAEQLGRDLTNKTSVLCTKCKYCLEKCPQKINIPEMISLYNEHVFSNGGFLAPMALQAIPQEHQPSACLSCGACEDVCPQNIKISKVLSDFTKILKN